MESPLIYSNLPVTARQEIRNTGTGQENALETSFITEPCENENEADGMTFGFWQTATGFTYEIPDCLMDRDFIEVHGRCLGKQISFELCTNEHQTKGIRDVIPLQVILNTNGQVTVMSRNKQKVEKQELFMRNCIQENVDFELCVYAYEDRYEVFINKQKICTQKHLVNLPDVFALSMDGDAEFHSVEFKDLYWEDEAGSSKLDDDVPTGFVRVQEMRESARNKKGEQFMVPVRNSFRSSQQSKTGLKQAANNEVSAWQTSADLSKPYLDKDYSANKSSPTAYNAEFRPSTGPQMYATMPSYGNQRISDYDPALVTSPGSTDFNTPTASKSKLTMGGSRKSITLSDEKLDHRLTVGGDIHQGNYRPIDDQYPTLRGSSLTTGSLITASTPSLQEKSKKKRFSLLGKHRKSKGSEPDIRTSVQLDQNSDVALRKSRGSAADVRLKDDDDSKKKKKFNFKNIFKRKKSKDSVEITPPSVGSATLNYRPSYQEEIYERPQSSAPVTPLVTPSLSEQPKELLKQPSAEIAAYLYNRSNYTHHTDTTLTGKSIYDTGLNLRRGSQDFSVKSMPSVKSPTINNQIVSPQSPVIGTIPATGTTVGSPSSIKVGKLTGSASEMASNLHSYYPTLYEQETTLTEMNASGPLGRGSTTVTIGRELSPVETSIPIKSKGNASEMASQILISNPSFTENDKYYTNLSGNGVSYEKNSPNYKRTISIDRDLEDPVFQPNSVNISSDIPNYAYSKNVQKTRQAVSLPDYESDDDNNLSEGSTVYTDGEYYLEVGKSAYYFERKRSLKNYRSRRSVKQEKAARRQMGLNTGDSDSAISSISSLKPGDRTMIPNATRRRAGAGIKEVKSWLDNQAPEYDRNVEVKVMPTAASNRIVYAEAPSFEFDQIDKYSTKDVREMLQNKDLFEFAIPLITGRQAIISGSFINPVHQNNQYGLIKLICCNRSFDNKPSKELANDLFMEVWSDGRLVLFTERGDEKNIICNSSGYAQTVIDRSKCDGRRFCIGLMDQSRYFAVTRDNFYTLIVPKSSFLTPPFAIKLEEPKSILLDQLTIVKCLALPLNLHVPPDSQGYHHLELITKLTADSEEINFTYNPKDEKQNPSLSVTMDLVQFKLYVTCPGDSAIRNVLADIPFVPEQIKSIDLKLSKEMDECALKIKVNKNEIVDSILGPADIVNNLARVLIDGDLKLIDAKIEEIH